MAVAMLKKVFYASQESTITSAETRWEWASDHTEAEEHSPSPNVVDTHADSGEVATTVMGASSSKAAKKKRKKKKKAAAATRHVRWGNVEEILFSRSVSVDGVPRAGTHPLGLGELREILTLSVDQSAQGNHQLLLERANTIGFPLKNRSEVLESRQWDFRIDCRNPLFGALGEEERAVIALSFENSHNHHSGVRDLKHDLDTIRKSRLSSGGCSCKPMKSMDKLSVAKLRTELLSRGQSSAGELDKLTKADLVKLLKEILRNGGDTLCTADTCECHREGIKCHSDVCGCQCSNKLGQLQHCGNAFGSHKYEARQVRRYRRKILRPDEPLSEEEDAVVDNSNSTIAHKLEVVEEPSLLKAEATLAGELSFTLEEPLECLSRAQNDNCSLSPVALSEPVASPVSESNDEVREVSGPKEEPVMESPSFSLRSDDAEGNTEGVETRDNSPDSNREPPTSSRSSFEPCDNKTRLLKFLLSNGSSEMFDDIEGKDASAPATAIPPSSAENSSKLLSNGAKDKDRPILVQHKRTARAKKHTYTEPSSNIQPVWRPKNATSSVRTPAPQA